MDKQSTKTREDVVVGARLRSHERAKLKERAERSGLSTSDYIRKALEFEVVRGAKEDDPRRLETSGAS